MGDILGRISKQRDAYPWVYQGEECKQIATGHAKTLIEMRDGSREWVRTDQLQLKEGKRFV